MYLQATQARRKGQRVLKFMTPSKITGKLSMYYFTNRGKTAQRNIGWSFVLNKTKLGTSHGRQHGVRILEISYQDQFGRRDLCVGFQYA